MLRFKKVIFYLFVSIIYISCNNLEDKIQGGWAIDQAYYNDQPVVWNLYSNGISFKEDKSCFLPIDNWEYRHTYRETGTWDIFNKNDRIYINIKTSNTLFNRTFEVQNLRQVQDIESGGQLLKMTLVSDSLKMDCTKALYE